MPTQGWIINRSFTLFLISRMVATAAIKMVPVMMGWYIYELTGSPLALGILGLCEVVPAVVFALPAGVKIDQTSRLGMVKKCLAFYTILMCLLYGLTLYDGLSINMTVWSIYIIIAFSGWVRAYYSPASSAILSQLVPNGELVKAATTNSMAWLASAIIGPLVGGLIIGWISLSIAILVCVVLLLLSQVIIFALVPLYDFIPKKLPGTWSSVVEGIHFVTANRPLLGAMSLDMFAVLFGGAVALLPVFAKDILHAGPQGFGLLTSATYLGNFVALLYFYFKPLQGDQGRKLIWSVGGFGLCILIFALSKSIWISFAALMISGLFDGVSMVVRSTIFQILVPDDMRGRVSAVSSIFINSSNELGQFESGLAARYMGTVPSVVFGGIMTIGIAIFTFVKVPSLRRMKY